MHYSNAIQTMPHFTKPLITQRWHEDGYHNSNGIYRLIPMISCNNDILHHSQDIITCLAYLTRLTLKGPINQQLSQMLHRYFMQTFSIM